MNEKLKEYQNKRNFTKTGEPSGKEKPTAKNKSADRKRGGTVSKKTLRFAVQYHLARRAHYDFRLEWDGVLLSWAVPKGPSFNPADKRLAVRVEDHPLSYADFEGTIPKGEYGGGTVMLWDEGEWEATEDFESGLKKGSVKIELRGERLKGKWALVRLKVKDCENEDWLLIKERDGFAKNTAGIARFTKGVRSGKTAAEIAGAAVPQARNPFDRAEIELAKLVESVPQGDDWLYEIKYDGYRIIAYCESGKAKLMTRNDSDFTQQFASVAKALEEWAAGRAMVLDGEIIAADADGRSDFQALQNFSKKESVCTLVYQVFDLLALDGEDIRGLPLIERKRRLENLLEDAPKTLRYSKHTAGNGERVFAAAARMKLEGIIGKRADSRYDGGRDGDWVKLKCYRRQEFVIGGYTRTGKNTNGVSALLLGVYEDGDFIYAGRAGTGIDDREAGELKREFDRIACKVSPFVGRSGQKRNEETVWLKPQYVAEIQFAEWTDEDQLRQASFKGLRADKEPIEVVREETARKKKTAAGARSNSKIKSKTERATEKSTAKQRREAPKQEIKTILKGDEAVKKNSLIKDRTKKSDSGRQQATDLESKEEEIQTRRRMKKIEQEDKKNDEIETGKQERRKRQTKSAQKEEKRSVADIGCAGKEAKRSTKRTAASKSSPAVKTAPKSEKVAVSGVEISNPQKIVFCDAGVKKIDVARYYERVAERMLRIAAHRVLSVVRCHKGVTGECFFKKHPATRSEGTVVVPIRNSEGEQSDYFYIDSVKGLIAETQLGSIEFHVWGSRAETLEYPDMMVFDFDPDEGMALEQIRLGVRDLKSVLDRLNLKSFLKTSGGKGYHVVVPFRPSVGWDTFHDFARNIAKLMENKWPERYTCNVRKVNRKGKIFIDWARNGRGSTSVAPYSLRARPGAKVSMPIRWSELDTVAPNGVDMDTALALLKKGDPWKEYFDVDQELIPPR